MFDKTGDQIWKKKCQNGCRHHIPQEELEDFPCISIAESISELRIADSNPSLQSLVMSLNEANISVCISPAPNYGAGGFSATLSMINAHMNYANTSRGALIFQFSPWKHSSGTHHDTGEYTGVFYDPQVDRVGIGCRRDGRNGANTVSRLCAECKKSDACSVDEEVMIVPAGHVLQDGDTIIIGCSKLGRNVIRDFDYTKTRHILRDRFWRHANVVQLPFNNTERGPYGLSVAVHMRNGDVTKERLKDGKRYTHAKKYRPFLKEVAALPVGCVATVRIVTEDATDPHVRSVVDFFLDSGGQLEIEILDDTKCSPLCALHTMAAADVLVAGYSNFAGSGAVLSNIDQIVAYAWTPKTKGYLYTTDPHKFREQLRLRCQI
uniref:Uncharacterized protein n=1 Tax=Proboscia inermis TaxID=420281 RepID=A0A7S0C0K0_9STRA|mmetsp:Transcript_20262/g.20530  ORF Transcript_20262/g.20530 Transcript_20262/m.20530 type:complete len:378 (+) Transcript_20262:167-1300(+)